MSTPQPSPQGMQSPAVPPPERTAGGALLLDGKLVAARVRAAVAARSAAFAARHGRPPGLAVVQVGQDPASRVYVRNKRKSSVEAGILALLHGLNHDERVDAILVQLPLPAGVDTHRVMDAVDPAKDVDGF